MRKFDANEVELMDQEEIPKEELEVTLQELEGLNRRFGGHRYALRFIARRFRPGRVYRVLDLGTGGGDFPRAMVEWARPRGVHLVVDAIDAGEAIVDLGREASADYPEIRFAVGDATTFESTTPYDLVHCSLSMHHFSTEQAVATLRRCRALSRRYVLITDLERSWVARLGIHLGNLLSGNSRMTVEDGDTSARRAFNYKEFRMLAKGAGWEAFGHARFFIFRQALWLPKD